MAMDWFKSFTLFCSAAFCFCGIHTAASEEAGSIEHGTFWHLTDIHVDQNYSRTGNPADLCHKSEKHKSEENGIYGNFLCDSPQRLLDLSIDTMKKIQQKPDFLIWTGDNLPHTRNPNPNWDVVFHEIRNITNRLREAFPGVPIYPSIGNHDTSPPNIIQPVYEKDSEYVNYLEKGAWKAILPNSTLNTFKHGGFYSHRVKPGLRIISLNTILWYQSNKVVQSMKDPSGQMQWFASELMNASKLNDKVYIIGHVAPGFYNRIYPGQTNAATYHPQFLKKYMSIIKDYSNVIAGQFFGHVHNDMFQIYHYDTGKVLGSGLLASSITPWYSNSPRNANVSIPVNPSVRLIYYNKTNWLLLNYMQYYLNLSKANELSLKDANAQPQYELLYSFTETYGVPDLSSTSLVMVYEKLKSSSSLFQTFFKYLTSAKESVSCDSDCKTAQLCSMACSSEVGYALCMEKTVARVEGEIYVSDANKSSEKGSHIVPYVVSAVCMFILVASVMLVLYFKRKSWCNKQNYLRLSDL